MFINLLLLSIFLFLVYQLWSTSKRLLFCSKFLKILISDREATLAFFASLNTEEGKVNSSQNCLALLKSFQNSDEKIIEILKKYGGKLTNGNS